MNKPIDSQKNLLVYRFNSECQNLSFELHDGIKTVEN